MAKDVAPAQSYAGVLKRDAGVPLLVQSRGVDGEDATDAADACVRYHARCGVLYALLQVLIEFLAGIAQVAQHLGAAERGGAIR